jgi:hypothetical protein
MKLSKPVSFLTVAIAVMMFFTALSTNIFWLAKLFGRPFHLSGPSEQLVYSAFALPDLVLSVCLYAGAFGLIFQRRFGYVLTWVAMGMWIFDSLLVLNVTRFVHAGFVGLNLLFAVFSACYLWRKSANVFG